MTRGLLLRNKRNQLKVQDLVSNFLVDFFPIQAMQSLPTHSHFSNVPDLIQHFYLKLTLHFLSQSLRRQH